MGKVTAIKKGSRKHREIEVLFGLVSLFLKDGKPVGSHTLKNNGFDHLSSATIRNYFAKLEVEGFLTQHHASGGRVPTDQAYRLFAEEIKDTEVVSKDDDLFLESVLKKETKEVSLYLQEAIEAISEMTGCAVMISAPRFDQDFIIDVKLLRLDENRVLFAIITDFSLVHTETIYLPKTKTPLSIEKIQQYFCFRLTGNNRPNLDREELNFAQTNYNEIILRHFVAYTNMEKEDIYRSGFSKLLTHSEFHEPTILSRTLALLESKSALRFMMNECFKSDELKYWIGEDLKSHLQQPYACSLIAIPYKLHTKVVGTIAVLGPSRLDYEKVFGILKAASKYISENLTKSMYKYKLTYRQPNIKSIEGPLHNNQVLGLPNQSLIIEKKHD